MIFFICMKIITFGQSDFSSIIGKEYNITFFKTTKFKKIITTSYYEKLNSSSNKFVRSNKSIHIFNDSLIVFNWLKQNDKPKKQFTQYFKQDSLGHLYDYDKNNPASENNYIIRNSKVVRDNSYDYWYDSQNRVEKLKTIDTTWYGVVNCCGKVEEYKYYGDSIEEIYSYRYNEKPEYKFSETISKIYKMFKSVIVSTTDAYDYKLKQYNRVSSTTEQYFKINNGVKCISTTIDRNGEWLTIKEYLYK